MSNEVVAAIVTAGSGIIVALVALYGRERANAARPGEVAVDGESRETKGLPHSSDVRVIKLTGRFKWATDKKEKGVWMLRFELSRESGWFKGMVTWTTTWANPAVVHIETVSGSLNGTLLKLEGTGFVGEHKEHNDQTFEIYLDVANGTWEGKTKDKGPGGGGEGKIWGEIGVFK